MATEEGANESLMFTEEESLYYIDLLKKKEVIRCITPRRAGMTHLAADEYKSSHGPIAEELWNG